LASVHRLLMIVQNVRSGNLNMKKLLGSEGKVSPCATLWRHIGEWMYRSTFFHLGANWWWVVSFAPAILSPGKESLVIIEQEVGWAPLWEEKILDPNGTRIPTPRLRYRGSEFDRCLPKFVCFCS
jgi:hypothetical protein